ncbi:MAG: hypothetical protein HS130_02970 [Deltaproteobacteria bacterium]|nr:hypothetical protein [Deltaproteobacteria bacterium]
MKRLIIFAVAAASAGFIAVGAGSVANAMDIDDYPENAPASGVGNSRHNLGALGMHKITNNTTEICVFCHTPHHTNVTGFAPGEAAPLWNRTNSAGSYTPYGPNGATVAGTSVSQVGGATLACLSCHDGVTTLDNLVNAPGKGLNSGQQGWMFSEMEDGEMEMLGMSPVIGGATSRLNIGTDLTNDHPVSIEYIAPRASLRDTSTTLDSIDLTSDVFSTTHSSVTSGGNLTQNRWAVSGYICADCTIESLLRNGKVECSSCHDPHFANKSWDEVDATWGSEEDSDGMFLRRVGGNTGSGVCKTCHAK